MSQIAISRIRQRENSQGETVIALPLIPRLNGTTVALGRDRYQGSRRSPRERQMSRIEQANVELVADVRPGHFADQFDVEPFGRGETRINGDQQSCRIHERNETDRSFSFI